jgi:MoaA/NifB/PqqE/SkfB family radical SAM enzyme
MVEIIEKFVKDDPRPPEYCYWDLLLEHLGGDTTKFFNGDIIYPRQFEIHLPSNHLTPCELSCPHCAGKYFQKDLGTWEMDGLELLNKLEGKIPYQIYGGAYTEPLLNPYFMAYLHTTKRYGNHFGIHTSGHLLLKLEKHQGWLTELNNISTDGVDYLSISLDAGTPHSWAKTKGTKNVYLFDEIIEAVRQAVQIREKAGKGHAIRICYLISPYSDTIQDFEAICRIARETKVDSIRFSIPFANYNQEFDKVRYYKKNRELVYSDIYKEKLKPYLSKSVNEKPYIFYSGWEFTDIDRFNFKKCIYSYFQITYGADGYTYRCSTTSTPSMPFCRLGKITPDLNEFRQMIKNNQNSDWDCCTDCFAKKARCNRMGLEINTEYKGLI